MSLWHALLQGNEGFALPTSEPAAVNVLNAKYAALQTEVLYNLLSR